MDANNILHGVRVLDLTTVVFGPYATQTLADLGAEVIKVEPPGGDIFRKAGQPQRTPGMGPQHLNLNRGKRSIALDLKAPADRAVMRDLVRFADIFIHNVRADAIDRLGFGYDAARALRPDLIYVHCVGFGGQGRYAGMPAYDDVIQAATGAATLSGRVDGTGAARYLPSLLADKVAGMTGAQAALAAYVHKLRTGEGQFVEVAMFEAFAHFMLLEHLAGLTFDPPNAPACYFRQIDPNRQPFPTADGHISIVPYTGGAWPAVFAILGDPTFVDRPEFATPRDMFENQALLYRRAAELTPARASADWVARFQAAGVPCMAVRDIADILDDPHLAEAGFFQRRVHPSEGPFVHMRAPVRYGAVADREAGFAPLLDEHADEIRAELERLKAQAGS